MFNIVYICHYNRTDHPKISPLSPIPSLSLKNGSNLLYKDKKLFKTGGGGTVCIQSLFVWRKICNTYMHIHIYLYGVTMKMEEGLIPLLSYTHDRMFLSVVQLSQIQVVLL